VINPESFEQRDQLGQNIERTGHLRESWQETQRSEPCVEVTSSVVVENTIANAVAEMATQRNGRENADQCESKSYPYAYDFIALSAHVYKEAMQFAWDGTIEYVLQSTQRPLVIMPAQETVVHHVHHTHEYKIETKLAQDDSLQAAIDKQEILAL
jgi:hypothetical protein